MTPNWEAGHDSRYQQSGQPSEDRSGQWRSARSSRNTIPLRDEEHRKFGERLERDSGYSGTTISSHRIAAAGDSKLREQPGSPMLTVVYIGLLAFCFFHFFRPQDFYLPLASIPIVKIIGIFTGAALVMATAFEGIRPSREATVLLALFGYLSVCIPFSAWRGGSLDVVLGSFSKVVTIALATMVAANTFPRLRRLVVLQQLAMVTMAILAMSEEKHAGRMWGVGRLFNDPNDFALNLCIVLPLAFAMLMGGRSRFAKTFLATSVGLIIFAIISTLSRGGFLALSTAAVAMWHRFRVKSGSVAVILALLLVFSIVAVGIVGSSSYVDRLSTIVDPQDEASALQRKELLMRSLTLTFEHPVFGVGPGQFQELSGSWHVTHNSYTQLSSEAGIPALAIFVALLWMSFKALKRASDETRGTEEWYLVGGLHCAMVTYIVGAFFLSTVYLFFPYILMAYCFAAGRIGDDSVTAQVRPSLSLAS